MLKLQEAGNVFGQHVVGVASGLVSPVSGLVSLACLRMVTGFAIPLMGLGSAHRGLTSTPTVLASPLTSSTCLATFSMHCGFMIMTILF